ncbi:hypothetical protein B0H19DRAFT_947402 [Mycena capillaripes]|nr:hypothetical protein B0H19DRAFT_947402 [Mycena capillaripes]
MRAGIVEALVIVDERRAEAVTDEEVDGVIWDGDAWKAPDSHRLQMGYVRRAWPVIAPWVREIFQASFRLGTHPHRLKASNAIPTPKPAKKDKTHPKVYRPVEQHAEVLAKPLEQLMANSISFEAEAHGFLVKDQFGE